MVKVLYLDMRVQASHFLLDSTSKILVDVPHLKYCAVGGVKFTTGLRAYWLAPYIHLPFCAFLYSPVLGSYLMSTGYVKATGTAYVAVAKRTKFSVFEITVDSRVKTPKKLKV